MGYLHIFLVLRWSGINFNISRFFIAAPILIFKDLQVSMLSPILYILNKQTNKQTKTKKAVLNKLKTETIFFYTYQRFFGSSMSGVLTSLSNIQHVAFFKNTYRPLVKWFYVAYSSWANVPSFISFDC